MTHFHLSTEYILPSNLAQADSASVFKGSFTVTTFYVTEQIITWVVTGIIKIFHVIFVIKILTLF